MTFAAGQVLTADDLNVVLGGWSVWTPTYFNITVGNGTVRARYKQTGKLVIAQFTLTWGTTTTSAGAQAVSLPIAPSAGYAFGDALGSAYLVDTSVGVTSRRGGTAAFWNINSGSVFILSDDAPGQTVSNTVPFTWANTDVLSFEVNYEAA